MTKLVTSRRRESQRGYALLMIFLMAAIIALMLYQQLPRVAFESEREKEQLLIDRGEQYVRAIQLYYLANNRQWPTSLEDLEKREKRFLRRRYVDPYTGKAEWRIIHTTGGLLTDSLVQKAPVAGDGKNASASNTTSNTPQVEEAPQVNAAVLQRPSDRPVTPTPGFVPSLVEQDFPPQSVNTPLPPITLAPQQQGQGALPPITLQPGVGNQGLPPITLAPAGAAPNGQQIPGQPPGGFRVGGGAPQFPGQPGPGGLPGGIQTGVPPGFRIDAGGQLVPNAQVPGPGISGQPQVGFPGLPQPGLAPTQPGSPQPGLAPTQPSGPAQGSTNAALNVINQLLTSPRQTPTTTTAATGNNQIGAIAGIASTHKGPSIKIYKDQEKYELWEFVFTPLASTGGGGVGTPGMPNNGQGQGGPNQPPSGNQPPTFGGPNTFGGGAQPFGGPPGTFGGPGPGPGGAGPGNGGPGNGKQIFAPGPGR